MNGWEGRRVLVTGGGGFLGSYVVERLRARGCGQVFVPRSAVYDLVDREAARRLFRDSRPDLVLHLAARVGGIGANQAHPARMLHDTLMMGAHVIDEAYRQGTDKVILVGTVCSYPEHTPVPFRERDLWNGYPEPTNAPYGIAKRTLLEQLRAYHQEYGLAGFGVLPANLYGPRDNFDLRTGHVIPALIRKCLEARERGDAGIVVWGAGEASREFLYVEECAEAILLAAERYQGAQPLNLGTGREIRIRELVAAVARATGFRGDVVYDRSRPDGQPRRALDVSRAEALIGFRAATGLEEGLAKTVAWFREHRHEAHVGRVLA